MHAEQAPAGIDHDGGWHRQQPAGLSELVEHMYVLRPIDGRMTYLRRGPQARSQPEDAVQQADLSLQTVSMHMASAPSPGSCCQLASWGRWGRGLHTVCSCP